MALPYINSAPTPAPPAYYKVGNEDVRPPISYTQNLPLWQMLRDFYDGSPTVKSKGELYLRKIRSHDASSYESYIARTPFYNAIRRTHQGLMASLFRRDPEYNLPPALDKSLGHQDKIVTTDGLTKAELKKYIAHELNLVGRVGAMVDYPTQGEIDPTTEPLISTYTAENIISWRTSLYRGRKITDRVILRESFETLTEYSTQKGERIRVLRLDPNGENGTLVYSQQIWSYDHMGTNTSQKPLQFTPKILGNPLDYIPFHFFGCLKATPDIQTPPLSDLVSVNADHYEASALLAHALFYAGMPTYVIAGEDNNNPLAELGNEEMAVGPSSIWRLNQGDKAEILEFTGHGLTFLENSVADKQAQMQSLGGRLITSQRRTASLTAEAYNVMEASDKATLMDVAYSIEYGMDKIYRWWAQFANVQVPASFDGTRLVEMNKEFDNGELSAREIRAIQTLYERNLIPLDVLYYTLRQVGVIPMEYSLEEFRVLLEKDDQLYKDPKLELDKQRLKDANDKAEKDRKSQESMAQAQLEASERASKLAAEATKEAAKNQPKPTGQPQPK